MLILGGELELKGKTMRIVRLVSRDQTLFEDATGAYIIEETYVMMKSAEGDIDFVTLASEKIEFTLPASSIKALDPITWRKP